MKQGLEKKRLKEDLSKKILSNFKKNKFNFTDLDLLIDTSLLTERSGEQFKKFTLTYKDLFGKEISLRPDLTVSTALKYIQEKKNKEEKYCYYGSAYRLDKEGDLKVFDQIGCEIINSYNNKSGNILNNPTSPKITSKFLIFFNGSNIELIKIFSDLQLLELIISQPI